MPHGKKSPLSAWMVAALALPLYFLAIPVLRAWHYKPDDLGGGVRFSELNGVPLWVNRCAVLYDWAGANTPLATPLRRYQQWCMAKLSY